MTNLCDVDFLQLDDLLSEREKATRNRVRELVEREVLPHIAEWYERAEFPRHLVPRLAALGLPGMKLKAFGGAGSVE